MSIGDFSSLFEIAATLNIALVAVEYASVFTQTVIEKVFKFKDYIHNKFDECKSSMIDEKTLDLIEPISIEGVSTLTKIEKLKREREITSKDIENKEKQYKEDVSKRCQSRSLSSLSLWLSLYSMVALFLIGIESTYRYGAEHFWVLFSIFTILFIGVSWIFGEKEKPMKGFDLSKLRHCIMYFAGVVVLCFLLVMFDTNLGWFPFIDKSWDCLLIFSVIIPFVNFFAFFIISRNKFKGLKNNIDKDASVIQRNCELHKNQVDDLLAVSRLHVSLTEEPIDSHS